MGVRASEFAGRVGTRGVVVVGLTLLAGCAGSAGATNEPSPLPPRTAPPASLGLVAKIRNDHCPSGKEPTGRPEPRSSEILELTLAVEPGVLECARRHAPGRPLLQVDLTLDGPTGGVREVRTRPPNRALLGCVANSFARRCLAPFGNTRHRLSLPFRSDGSLVSRGATPGYDSAARATARRLLAERAGAEGECSGDVGLMPLRRIKPVYPASLRRAGTVGYVRVSYAVAADGSTTDIRVVESEPGDVFDQAVVDAVSKWRFCPPIPGVREYPRMRSMIPFALSGDEKKRP